MIIQTEFVSEESADGEDNYDKYSDMYELGRTPPRSVMASNRKWHENKKHIREMGKRWVKL